MSIQQPQLSIAIGSQPVLLASARRAMYVSGAMVALFLISSSLRSSVLFLPIWAIVFLGMSFTNTRYMLYVLLASLFLFAPGKPQGTWFSLTDVVVLAVAVRMLFSFRYPLTIFYDDTDRKEESLLLALLALATLSVVIVYFRGADATVASKALLRLGEYFIAFICLSGLLREETLLERAQQFLVVLAIIISLFGVYQHWLGPRRFGSAIDWGPWWAGVEDLEVFRVSSVFTNPIYLSIFCACLIPISLDGVGRNTGRLRNLYATSLLTASLCLTFTISRTGLVAAIGGTLIVVGRSFRLLSIASLTLVLDFWFGTSSEFGNRLFLRDFNSTVNIYARVVDAVEAVQLIKEHAVFGVGLGQYPNYVMHDFRGNVSEEVYDSLTAENTFLQFGAELGLIGMLLMILLHA